MNPPPPASGPNSASTRDPASPAADEGPGPQRFRLAKLRHDLRTPINHVIGFSEILLEDSAGRVPDWFRRDLERIESGGRQLLVLISQYFNEDYLLQGQQDLLRICHDLRTPVNHIIGYSELLSEQCEELGAGEFRKDLDKIRAAARAWLDLMEAGLDLPPRSEVAVSATPAALPPPAPSPAEMVTSLVNPLPGEQHPFRAEQGRLLLADDDTANRELLQRRLERLGYEVVVVADGLQAWEQVQNGAFDLVLLDLLMPGLEGHEVLARIKADPALRHLPVIVFSALDHMEGAVRCIELGAEDYLAKPVNPILLRARIGAALEQKRLRDWEQVYLRQMEDERSRFERLLLNILPRPIADRLKQGEGVIVDSFAEVTVLFADLVGFTALSLRLPPTLVVRLLDEIFSAFDELAARHGLEKIKTIGDAYMAVAGLPSPRGDHAPAAARMALDMQAALKDFNRRNRTALAMRLGMNSGPVIAGIIGRNKFSYDLWGDTVNTASRMESHGEPGTIQITAATAERLRPAFVIEPRGPLTIKGRGTMETFFLRGPAPGPASA